MASDKIGDDVDVEWIIPIVESIKCSFLCPEKTLDIEGFIKYLCNDEDDDYQTRIIARYDELRDRHNHYEVMIVPKDGQVMSKLVAPIESARRLYYLGDYLACIAMCGYCCEMAVIFLCDRFAKSLDRSLLSDTQKSFFQKGKYKRLDQDRRIRTLVEMDVLPDVLIDSADSVRKIRNEYMHQLSKNYNHIVDDAKRAYYAACCVTKIILHIPFFDGAYEVPHHLRGYLEAKGVCKSKKVVE